jgi:tetratricopeptide (TPR) repeat protein
MAEISLKEYLARVDTLLKEQASDEVIHHCRHILQYFPKNVAAYRALGVALADRSRWNDVAEVFRRVLSAFPDDETAHLGLSEAYERMGKYDDAIWHLERAFEQEPNNDTIINKLRELYLRHRQVEHPKVQLTAGAVARQYARNGLYDQAIDTLQQALERTPDRYDLRLLLAQMLWESGYRVDAAETALDVLRVLPDCLQANRILTELWLSEGRPSDAQRYLSRVEALDPYLALELAHGQPPPDDALRLQELDYERAAKRELTTAAPDWLGELGSSDAGDWMASFKETSPAQTDTPTSDLLETALPDDWLADVSSPASVPPSEKRTGITGLLASLAEETPDEAEAPAADELPADVADEPEGMPDLFPVEETGEETEAAPDFTEAAAPVPQDDDPLAWLHQSGVEIIEDAQPQASALFDADEEFVLQEPDKANPLAWLEGYEAAAEGGLQTPDEEADPLAWLHQSGVEIVDERPQPAAPTTDAQDEALLDWLADESVLDEVLHMEALSTDTLQPVGEEQADAEDRFMAGEVEEVEMSDDNEFNWLDEQQPEEPPASGEAGLDWLAQSEETAPPPSADMPDWLTAAAPGGETGGQPEETPAPQSGDAEWMVEMTAAPEPAEAGEDAGFEWMAEAEAAATPADTPDWLSEMAPPGQLAGEPEVPSLAETQAPSEPAAQDAGFEWMGEAEAVADTLDWLSEMAPSGQPSGEPEAPSPAEAGLEWLSEAQDEPAATPADTPDWLSEAAPVGEPETPQESDAGFEWIASDSEAAAAADTPDWLAEMRPAEEPAQAADAGFEWMADAQPEAGESPDWLSALEPEGAAEPAAAEQGQEEAEPAAATDSGFEWISETQAASEAAPEWLSEIAPAEEAQTAPTSEGDFEWMSGAEAETPGWLSEIAPAGETEAPASLDAGVEWLSEVAPAAETSSENSFEWAADVEPAASTETPDWLSELGPAPEEAAAPADSPSWLAELDAAGESPVSEEAPDTPGWPSEIAPSGETEAAAGDMPDWLAAMAPAQEMATGDESSEESEFDWEAEPAEDQPEWLSSLKPETAQPPEPVTATSEFSWLDEMNTPEEPMGELESAGYVDSGELEAAPGAPAPAENAPDWLNAMVPGLDVDYEAPEDEPIETEYIQGGARREELAAATTPPSPSRDFEWLNQIVAEEALQPQPAQQPIARRRFVFSRQPVWLRRPVEQQAAQSEEEDNDFPGWLRDDDADDKDFDLPPWLQ